MKAINKEGRVTPDFIKSLKPNEVFVFGSNLAGMHGGGAARIAHLYFGAVMGNEGVDGIDGQRTDDTAHHDGEAEGEHVTAKGEGGAP